jgi:hypothetical protein
LNLLSGLQDFLKKVSKTSSDSPKTAKPRSPEGKMERAMGIEPTLVAWEGSRHVSEISKITE